MTGMAKVTVLSLLANLGASQTRQHVLRGAPEPDNAYVDAAVYSPHEWILKEGGEP